MIRLLLFLSLLPSPLISADLSDWSSVDLKNVLEAGSELPLVSSATDEFLPEKASYIQMTSSVKLKADAEKGELRISFPKVDFGDQSPEDKAFLFVKAENFPARKLSWVTVLCSGNSYLGYKGSNLLFPESSGSFSVGETLALGSFPKRLIERTHPWLLAALPGAPSGDPERLCSKEFRESAKNWNTETLPKELDGVSFEYNPKKNTLKVSWKK